MKSKFGLYTWEIGKWALVIYLLLPLTKAMNGVVDFNRIVIGETLLIIFIGKMFYDTVIWKFIRTRNEVGKEIIGMIGLLVSIGFILVMFFLLFGVTLLLYFKNQSQAI